MSDNLTEVCEAIRLWSIIKNQKVNVVIAGRDKSGKTSLASALCGISVPKEQDPEIKCLYNRSTSLHYDAITVWDACGMFDGNLAWKSDVAIKKMREIKCLTDGKNSSALVYTISAAETLFVDDANANLDFLCMKRLTDEFASTIWNNAVIVLTYVNKGYETFKSQKPKENEDVKRAYQTFIQEEWRGKIRRFLKNEILPEEKAKSIPIICVGFKQETGATTLKCDLDGESWVLKVWQNIASTSPLSSSFLLLDYCFKLNFQGPFLYSDSLFFLMKLHGKVYQSKACEVEKVKECSDIGLAYSFLHFVECLFNNFHKFKPETNFFLKSSEESLTQIRFWRGLESHVNVFVTGADHSGKTTIINSMLYGKSHIPEVPENYGTWKLEGGNVKCSFHEVSLRSLHTSNLDNLSLLIVCMMLDDTKENMTRILTPVVDKRPNNLMIAFTFSAINLSGKTWIELFGEKTGAAKGILKALGMDETIVNNVPFCPAGYHTDPMINGDPSCKHWIMNMWLNSIASAKLTSQSAMVYFINYCWYRNKGNIAAEHKKWYIKHLIRILSNMIQTHNTSFENLSP